jgi:hypothetical protein
MSHDQLTPIAKPRRRWFQYSLRTPLVLITVKEYGASSG